MTKVITFATTKGGTGKTTLALSFTCCLHEQGFKVAALDTDPNHNLSNWFGKGELKGIPSVSESDENYIIDAIDNLGEKADFVVVDMAGFGNQALVYAIGISSLVVIPARTSEDDVLEALKTKQIVKNTEKLIKTDIPYQVVLTQVRSGTLVTEHSKKQFDAFSVPLFKTEIGNRTIFQQCRFEGTSPYKSTDPKATLEIESFTEEVKNIIK